MFSSGLFKGFSFLTYQVQITLCRPKFKLLGHDNKQPLNPQLFFFPFLRYGMGGGGHEHEALKVLSSGAGAPGCASRGGIPPARPMLLSTDAEYRSGKEGGWGKCGAFEIKRRRDKKTKKKSVGSRFASIRSLARAAQYQHTMRFTVMNIPICE